MANEMFELKVREVIAETLSVPIEDVIDTADIIEDLGADSIDVLDLIVNLEREFNIEIPDSDVINNRIVDDIVRYIISKK